jgi:prepilin-type N-terminal cleavage/methylation domain-containing protein
MSRYGADKKTRRAFTLIEMLTSIAILSILISILAPSLSGARQRGRMTKCTANIRELDAATLRYVSQNNDTFPLATDCSEDECYFWNGHQYFGWNGLQKNVLDRYWVRPVNNELGLEPSPPDQSMARIAQCPNDIGAPGETGTTDPLYLTLGSSYPINPILCQGGYSDWKYRDGDLGLTQILQPSRKVLVSDHPAFGMTFDGFWTAIRPGWHDQTRPAAVIGFIDGHAEYVLGNGNLREWQWYGEASGPTFTQNLSQKVSWPVLAGCE